MKNIFVEGIQGSGKSTLINNIVKFNPELHVCREGDYSPIELAWCALMSKKEYEVVLQKYNSIRDEIIKNTVREQENYIITYTRIITDIPGFYKDLENYEVYNGRKTLAELKEIIVTRFKNFTDTGYLFECSFFQNVIEDLILFHMLSDEEIIEFYRNLFRCIDAKKFILFYEAIFIPEGVDAPPKEIINAPELQIYVQDFGKQEGDICFVAEVDKKIVGAVWVRNMDDYGHVEDGVPSFAISLYREYRGLGIGTMLMKRMLEELKERGYQKTSLAVQKANYAVKMYKNVGFEIIDENEEEYIMMYVFR